VCRKSSLIPGTDGAEEIRARDILAQGIEAGEVDGGAEAGAQSGG
jgi:hypothetical protein